MTYPTNILQQVQTYQPSSLALLQNICVFIEIANKKFQNFQNMTANLGSTVNFDLPYRFVSSEGLVANLGGITQRLQPLTVDQANNVSYAVSDPQRIFNYSQQDYMANIGNDAIAEEGANIERNLALNCESAVPVNNIVNGNIVPTGALHTESGPFRFYGDGVTAINSYQQLDQMIENFLDFGAVKQGIRVVLPNVIFPAIIGNGLTQFALDRNNQIANSWDVGSFGNPPVKYYKSNLLPIHVSGTLGQAATTLTVVSTNDPTGAAITQITCSGAGTDANAVKSGDLGAFKDGVTNQPDMRYLTFVGHSPSSQQVQFRATASAASSGGNVTFNIYPALCSQNGNPNQNLNNAIAAGMQIKFLPSHRCGIVIGGNGYFLGMPRMPEQTPFPSSNKMDETSGANLLMYYGSIFGQAQQGIVNCAVWGSTMVPEYCMRVIVPL